MPGRLSYLQRWRPNPRSGHFWFGLAGVAFTILALVVLRKMEHPWEGVTAKRLRLGRPLDPPDLGRIYGFWFGLVAMLTVAMATIGSLWWWAPAHPRLEDAKHSPRRTVGGRVWIALALLLTLAAWLGALHLDRTVRRDEQDTLRYHIHGYYAPDSASGELEFIAATWADAFFGNEVGNNPVLLSVAAKSSLALWRQVTDLPEDRFSNVAIRLPGYLACCLAVVAMAWCVRGYASAGAAAIGTAMLMCHPAFVEYSLQARGYVFVMLGVPVVLGSAIRALERGDWRYWIGLVGGCALMLYAYLGSLFFVAPIALSVSAIVAVRYLKSRKTGDPAAKRDAIRLTVVGAIGVSLYLTAAMPPLISFWINRENFPWSFDADAHWWLSLVTEYAGGRIFAYPTTPEGDLLPMRETIPILVKMSPWVWIGIVLVLAMVGTGLVRVWRDSRPSVRVLLIVACLTPFLQIAVHAWVTHMVLFAYYMLYWLPVVLCLAAIGGEAWCEAIAGHCGVRTRNAVAVVIVMVYFWTSGIGGMGYLWEKEAALAGPEVFSRGSQHWIVYPEERMLRLPKELPVPGHFPEGMIFPSRSSGGGD